MHVGALRSAIAPADPTSSRRARRASSRAPPKPLLFFLKALDDDEELRSLLRREIDARSFFLLCDSDAARRSPWVQDEHEYVRQLIGKQVVTIPPEAEWNVQLAAIDYMLTRATAFLSYAHTDRDRVAPFADLLSSHDLTVWNDFLLSVGQNFQTTIRKLLQQAAENGYLIGFLSMASLRSRWVQ